jgi:hypothetical protein
MDVSNAAALAKAKASMQQLITSKALQSSYNALEQ